MNQRRELKAYTDSNACRLAALLKDLLPDSTNGLERDTLKQYWARFYPQHKTQTGKKSISQRISSGLSLLKVAKILVVKGDWIVVTNVTRLRISAKNLTIVQDARGRSIRPGLWAQRPVIPSHLLATHIALEKRRPSTTKVND